MTDKLRARAEEVSNDCVKRLFRLRPYHDLSVVFEPEKWLADALLQFRAEGVAAERERCAKVCRDKAIAFNAGGSYQHASAVTLCAEEIEYGG